MNYKDLLIFLFVAFVLMVIGFEGISSELKEQKEAYTELQEAYTELQQENEYLKFNGSIDIREVEE